MGPDLNHTASKITATNDASAGFAGLLSKLDYLSDTDIAQVRLAYRFADEAHLGQLRNNGEPYITHPIAVAAQCTEWKLDAQALMAALLHDAIEDCGVTKMELIERFGAPVAELVDGLTKLDKLQFNTREESQAESFRKMLLAMARDVRVILIKLADRSHNMRTLADVPRSKWRRISRETLDIYAPIAHRLGLNQTYHELQDLSFRHLHPWRYQVLARAVDKSRSRKRDLINNVKNEVETAFANAGMPVRFAGRQKTLYSIFRKMHDKHLSFAQVSDLYGFRVLVASVTDCYTALGLLHQLYKPVPGKFKDHIAIPKLNGYQSLHTTLVGPSGLNIEFQMRTEAMHLVAESGVAAHWLYKVKEPGDAAADRLGNKWLQSLLDIQDATHDAAEFLEHVKVDLFSDAVYVLTPKSRIVALPRGATVVDFAYAIHSNIGDHIIAARVNGAQVPLRTQLKNGNVIEVITDVEATPNPAWLSFVRTGRARSKIRHSLKSMEQTESTDLGQRLLQQALRNEGLHNIPLNDPEYNAIWDKLLRFTGNKSREELLSDMGLGKRIASIVAKRLTHLLAEAGAKPDAITLTRALFNEVSGNINNPIILDGSENASVLFAHCCRPIPGDAIAAHLGRGEGLTIHREHCPTAIKLRNKDSERFIKVEWSDDLTRLFEVGVVVTVSNSKGVLAKVSAALASAEADIVHIDMGKTAPHATADLNFIVAVRDVTHLDAVLKQLRKTYPVLHAERRMGS
jgi:GTP diphosphokinase / guanosine-3',5'-bis(diphosphate) 3'-diphosphatase